MCLCHTHTHKGLGRETKTDTYTHGGGLGKRWGESGKEDSLRGILFSFLGEEKSYLRNSLMSVGNNGIHGTLSCKRGCKYKFQAFSVPVVLW